MALTGAYRIQLVGGAPVRVQRGGRHRLGAPGLHYCRHLRPVRHRLVRRELTRHRAPVSPMRVSASLVVLLMTAGTVLVSGWYAAAGAAVIVDIVRP